MTPADLTSAVLAAVHSTLTDAVAIAVEVERVDRANKVPPTGVVQVIEELHRLADAGRIERMVPAVGVTLYRSVNAKRVALLALAAKAREGELDLVDAALTQIAGCDLDDPAVCRKWANACAVGSGRSMYRRETDVYERAEMALIEGLK